MSLTTSLVPAATAPIPTAPSRAPSARTAAPTLEDTLEDLERRRRRSARRDRLGAVLATLGSIAAALFAWQAAIWVFDLPSYTLPTPGAVGRTIIEDRELLRTESWPTIQEILLGFLLSVGVGVPLGVAIVEFRWLGRLVEPLIVGSQAVPKIAVAPLFVVWWGFGMTAKVVIAFLIAFFPVVVATAVGLRSVSGDLVDLGRSMGAGRLAMLLRVKLPGALPNLFGGLKVAMTLAVIGAVVGEFVGADRGLGRLIVIANGRLNTELVFASVVVLTVIGVVAYKVVEASERLLIPWSRERTAHGSDQS